MTTSTVSGLPGTPTLLEVNNIATHFGSPRGVVQAVNDVSFTLERGKTLGLVGESGSGKSVLSRSVMGLLPSSVSHRAGTVSFEGNEIQDYSETQRRDLWGKEMSMVFQDPMTALNPVMRIGKQITESLRFHLDMGKQEAKEWAISLLDAVRIPEPAKRFNVYPHELSGGMRQRVVIAIALACGPKLLFADEPTTALDVTVQAQILDLLQEQQRERYMSMILVTHDLGVVAARADEIAVMYAGRIVERAPTAELFSNMRMPYTEALLSAIPKLTDPSHTRLTAIEGRPPDLVNPPSGCPFAPRCMYAQEQCFNERPELIPDPNNPSHLYACFYPVGSPAQVEIAARLRVDPKSPTPPSAPEPRAPEVSTDDNNIVDPNIVEPNMAEQSVDDQPFDSDAGELN